jgi:hypothetical protein
VDGLKERHPVHRGGDHAAAGVPHGRDPGHLVAEAHDHATVHEAPVFESAMPSQRVSTDCEADGCRGSTRR